MTTPHYDLDTAQAIMEFIEPIRGVDDPDNFLPKPILYLLINYVEQTCEQISHIISQQLSFESPHPGLKHEESMERFLNTMQDYAEDWSQSTISANDIMSYFQSFASPSAFPPKPVGAYLMEVYRERVYAFAELVEEYYGIDGFTKELRLEVKP